MIIHLNGWPGVGKLSIAEVLAERMNARLIDNHSLINTARIPWEHGTDEYMDLLLRITVEVSRDLAQQPHDEVQIFTNALAVEYKDDVGRLQRIADLAERRSVPFVPVLLDCDEQENARRLETYSRALKEKLRDPDILAMSRRKYTILHWPDHPNAIRVDVTDLQPEQSADAIIEFLTQKGLWHD